MSDVKLGTGNATGMFYHAPAGTALPTYPGEQLAAGWKEVGDVTDAGITLALNKSVQNLRNWANVIKRVILTDHSETVQSPIMDTTEESLKTVVGEDNVTVTPASSTHGKLIDAHLSSGSLAKEEAYLWIMKDGDDMIAIGCTNGQVTAIENVSFNPTGGITWTPTITAMGDGFHMISDDGQVA
jgi:hypothetical protein